MSWMDVVHVLNEIKNDPVLKIIPVVILTSSGEERDLVQSYKLGVNAYIVKPVNLLLSTIDRSLSFPHN